MPIVRIFLLVALAVSFARASDSSALNVSTVIGKVEVRSPGKEVVELKKDQRLSKGTQLRGSKDALAVLTGSDGSQVKLEGETVLEIIDYSKIREFKLDRGMAVFKAAPGAAGSFKVRTRAAVMGVRGTQFFVAYSAGGDEWMCVKEGVVEVSSPKNEQNLVLVKAGQGVQIEINGAISKPQKFEWTEKIQWDMSGTSERMGEEVLKQGYEDIRVRNYD